MEIPLHVLIAEDSEDDALLLERELRRGGYDPETRRVETAEGLASALMDTAWDIVVTDHNMPQFDSNEVIRIVRDSGLDIPIIVVSGSIGEDVAVETMKAGASDYIMKNNMMRLIPAIDRELREAERRRAHRRAEAVIHRLAYHDALTDLVNRNEFERRLGQALATAKERGAEHAVLYLDLDQFKIVNDTCGHAAGDELLRQVALLFRESVRGTDTLARLGGDEFGILLENCPLDRAQGVADKLLHAVADYRFVWEQKTFPLGASVGISVINTDSIDISEVLSAADMACYAAKDSGRNRAHVYSADDEDLARRHGEMQWVSRINSALDEDRFRLWAQPIVRLNGKGDNRTKNELLVRLLDEKEKLVMPGAFIPAAERYNLMTAIDRQVIRKAFEHIRDNVKTNGQDRPMFFINLSGTSLNDDDLARFVRDELQAHKVNASDVCFEITETAAIANMSRAIAFITEARALGCHIALDDFGSGLSSFSYLKTMPVDYLKIDGSFVRDMANDAMDSAIVEAIAQIGRVVGIQTIAEFVESDEIRERLREIGVNHGQGYGIQRPRPLDEVEH